MNRTPQLQIGKVQLDAGLRRALTRRARRVVQRLGVEPDARGSLCVRVVDDIEMTRLHEEHLGEAGPTDVLSFPAEDDRLGDVALDWDAVYRQAADKSRAGLLHEATNLLVHGIVHLLGHDHASREEARRMHRIEKRALRGLGVEEAARPYGPGGRLGR